MDARSKPYFFWFETNRKPGKIIAHAVRFETIELDSKDGTFDATTFTLLGADADKDPRIQKMADSVKGGNW